MPETYEDFITDDDNVAKANLNLYNKQYSYLLSVNAIINNVDLINKCTVISRIPLNLAMWQLSNTSSSDHIGKLDLTAFKLLHEHNYNINTLLKVAYNARDYNCIRYIIDNMTDVDLDRILGNYHVDFMGLINVLFMEKIFSMNNKYLMLLLHKHMTLKFTNESTKSDTIILCYYIIKYLTVENGKKYIKELNKRYKKEKSDLVCSKDVNDIKNMQTFADSLLEFHFNSCK
jgi:hypothetical protein